MEACSQQGCLPNFSQGVEEQGQRTDTGCFIRMEICPAAGPEPPAQLCADQKPRGILPPFPFQSLGHQNPASARQCGWRPPTCLRTVKGSFKFQGAKIKARGIPIWCFSRTQRVPQMPPLVSAQLLCALGTWNTKQGWVGGARPLSRGS